MGSSDIVFIAFRFVVVGITAFLAIVLWSRTRDMAWMLVVIAAVAGYAEVMFDVLVSFGLVEKGIVNIGGIEAGRIIVANLPDLLFASAFITMILRKRSL